MEQEDERVLMITHAIGRVVFEMSVRGEMVDKDSIIEMLEFYRRITTNVTGKGIYRMRLNWSGRVNSRDKKPARGGGRSQDDYRGMKHENFNTL